MPKVIRFHQAGGPEVLRLEEVDVGEPGEGEVRVRHTAAGVNFIDTYHRGGLYALPLPSGLGVEGAGVVEAVGKGVSQFQPGDRVAYAGGPPGSYSEVRVMPAGRLLKLPDEIGDDQAAAMMLKGLTCWMLFHRVHQVRRGEKVLFHAAAGGVGLIAVQWLKALGATVIGTVGTDEKAKLVRARGCDHAVVYTREDFVARVKELTGGGVPVVYDSVGKETFSRSLDCLAPTGLMVSFGNSSGAVPPFDILQLSQKGSLFLTRPTLFSYTAERPDLEEGARRLFEMVGSGKVKVDAPRGYRLAEAAEAHRDLQARKTTGSLVLRP